ncbi:PucR family transcriptional regulator [Nocardia sp. CA-290969]|uniref:PucR family transcriptional regulator n=1 Tax=Nocardia sp. CA-290969 TaxID=3239986 RepID=UPI003D8DC2A4
MTSIPIERPRPKPPEMAPGHQVSELIAQIGASLRARESELAEAMTHRIVHEVPDPSGLPGLGDLRAASIRANMATAIDMLADRIPIHHLQPPTAAVECVRREAQWGIPSSLLVRSYHLGQGAMMRICHSEVGRRNLPGALGLAVIERLTELIHSYADWITRYLFETYEVERKQLTSVSSTTHSTAVRRLLSASTPDPMAFEAETGYALDRTHLAVIMWYTGKDRSEAPAVLDTCVRAQARALGCGDAPLIAPIDRHTLWAWFPFNQHTTPDTGRLRSADLPGKNVRLAIGLPGPQTEGFRRSHRQAAAAHRVSAMPGVPTDRHVIGFGDPGVAMVSLVSDDLDSTREWIRATLGELAYDTDHAAILRETLATFYETGESHVHTAQKMTLHRNTVKYRITKALAATPSGGSAPEGIDIALALRVCRFLGSTVLRPPV